MEIRLNSGKIRLLTILLGCLIALMIVATNTFAQAQSRSSFIYGTIKTEENSYKGYMRWGKEEAFWFEYFNAAKQNNDHYRNVVEKKGEKKSAWYEIEDWSFSSIWDNKKSGLRHEFSCQFGDIEKIGMPASGPAVVYLKNGVQTAVNGTGYNDMGTTIEMLDEEIGSLKIKWSRIKEIIFQDGAESTGKTFGDALFAQVQTARKGTITGFVMWDKDERVSSDMLDGDSRDGDVSIAFGKIAQIRKEGNGSVVTLKSGRSLYLTDSNDVNKENRGIIVYVSDVGEVEIPWRAFVAADFVKPDLPIPGYKDYKAPKGIEGEVFLHDNTTLKGKIMYDVDEMWEIETLEAKDDDISYRIPFKNIKAIKPKNYDYSMVTLRNGESLLLGGERDVSDANDGLLVFSGRDQEPKHIPWDQISEIVFN